MFSLLCKLVFIKVLLLETVLSCNDTLAGCNQWGLTDENECITNPGFVTCNCEVSCKSLSTCPGNVTDDTDCKCRKYAMDGLFEADSSTYMVKCPTTFNLRLTVTCPNTVPANITNGIVDNTTLKVTYKYMDQVRYICINGFTFSGYGEPRITCNLDGQWHWGVQTNQTSCDVPTLTTPTTEKSILTEIEDFEPGIKEAKGAAVLGTFGILIIIGVIGCIIGLDCLSCKRHCALGKRNTKKFRKWFHKIRNKSGNKPQSPIDSNELKSINDTKTPDEEPCSSQSESKTSNNVKEVQSKPKLPNRPVANARKFMTNGIGSTSNIATQKGAGKTIVGLNSRPIASTSFNNNSNSVKPQSKYTKPIIKRTLIRKPPSLPTTKTSQL